MNTQLDISYRNMDSSPTVDYVVKEQLAKLERHCPSLISCRVVVTAPPANHTKGGHFHVTVDLTIPGKEIVADRAPFRHSHEDCHTAVRDAFRAALKELERFQSRKTSAKRHPRGPSPTLL